MLSQSKYEDIKENKRFLELIASLNACKDESDTNGHTNDDEADTSNKEDTSTEAKTNAVALVPTRSELMLESNIEEYATATYPFLSPNPIFITPNPIPSPSLNLTPKYKPNKYNPNKAAPKVDGIKAGKTKATTTAEVGTANNLSEDLITPRISSIAGGDVVFANQDVHRDSKIVKKG